MRARFNVTYDRVTPESAAHGDVAESGFLDWHGIEHDMSGVWGERAAVIKRETAMSLRRALQVFGGGIEEAGNGRSFYQVDGRTDYATGEETRLAFHLPDNVTAASYDRVRRLLA